MTKAKEQPKDVEPEDFIDVIIKRVERGDVFTIDKNGKPVAIVVPPRYLEKLQENIGLWNDGRLVLTGERRWWHTMRWLWRNLNRTAQNPPPPSGPGVYEAEGL
jgi:prevent-host-death family protein